MRDHPAFRGIHHLALRARLRWIAFLAAPVAVFLALVALIATGLVGVPTSTAAVLVAASVLVAAAAAWLPLARRAWAADRSLCRHLRDVFDDRDLAAGHVRALDMLDDYRQHDLRFLLFLRSFEPEAAQLLTPDGTGTLGTRRNVISHVGPATSPLESEVLRVAAECPILGVANPQSLSPPSEVGLQARLQLPSEGWLETLRDLIAAAHTIVVDLYTLAPGVKQELQTIAASQRKQDTLIVIPPPGSATRLDHRVVATVLGATTDDVPAPTFGHPALQGFPHVAEWDPEQTNDPVLSTFLNPRLRLLDAHNALATNRHAVALMDEGRHGDALPLLERALALATSAHDQGAQALTHSNFGVAYADGLHDRARAIRAIEHSLALFRAAGNDDAAREAGTTLAVLFMESGQEDLGLRYLLHPSRASRLAADDPQPPRSCQE